MGWMMTVVSERLLNMTSEIRNSPSGMTPQWGAAYADIKVPSGENRA